jgi:phospholipase C
VLDVLGTHPDVWRHTVLLINYDENDGFFDHVPPPVPPADDPEERWEGKPTGLGMRVPLLVVSPWSTGGHVCSEVFDHTSVIRLLEKWTGVEEPGISRWRRTVTGDLTSAFDFGADGSAQDGEPSGAVHPVTRRAVARAGRWTPVQEAGVRPARALPYRTDAHGRVEDGAFSLLLSNTGQASAHFALYPYAGEFAAPQHRDVTGTAHWTVPLGTAREAYRFTVTGPNGFRREFAGPVAGHGPEVSSAVDHRCRDLRLILKNGGDRPVVFTVRRLGYVDQDDPAARTRRIQVNPGTGREVVHSAAGAHGWYDLEITTETTSHHDAGVRFRRRLMGHIENGRASVSG